MKKLIALLLSVAMAASLAACGGSASTAASSAATSQAAGDSATNGHVTVEVYGNGQLGTEKEMLDQVVAGTIQGMRGGQFDFSPRLLMFTLPFLTQTRAQVTALLQSDLAKSVCAEAEAETGT